MTDLVVTQADRDAAAEYCDAFGDAHSAWAIRDGKGDHYHLVLIAARHRLAHAPAWRPIEEAEGKGPYLICHRSWINADVGMIDSEGSWYSPMDGGEFYPQPTHFQPLPSAPGEG